MMFTHSDYATLHSLVFRNDYPGYRPNIVEAPNGDGKLDTDKRFAHVALKYLTEKPTAVLGGLASHPPETFEESEALFTGQSENIAYNKGGQKLRDYLKQAHALALEVAISIGVPPAFWPSLEHSALRVLEYSPTAVTNPHTDFDLFTLMMYRNHPEYFKYVSRHMEQGYNALEASKQISSLKKAQHLNAQVHFGELLEEISPDKSWAANKHEVVASGGPTQYSVVYFAIPSAEAVLPSGISVGKWMEERKGRSRYEK